MKEARSCSAWTRVTRSSIEHLFKPPKSFRSDTLQQTTVQQPAFQLHKLVNSSHNKPANVIQGNIDQPNGHPSSVNLQLGGHMLWWQYQLPTNTASSREIFFFLSLSLFFSLISSARLSAFQYLTPGVSWVRGWMHASVALAQQGLAFLGQFSEAGVKEGYPGKMWCEIWCQGYVTWWKKSLLKWCVDWNVIVSLLSRQ